MNIGQLAKAANVTTDTLRYYEKQGLISAPARLENGYRAYTDQHVELVRFVRGAQSLGFSLAEIRVVVLQLAEGKFGRVEIERQLTAKMAQIDLHMRQLKALKKELAGTFSMLKCAPDQAISAADGTPADVKTDAGITLVKKAFSNSGKKYKA